MKKLLISLSIILLLIIIAEIIYLMSRTNNQVLSKQQSERALNSIPTPTSSPSPENNVLPDYVVFEGKVILLETMNEGQFKYKINLEQPDGKINTIQFEESNLGIMTVKRIDTATKEEIMSTFADININNNLKIEIFLNQGDQQKTEKRININRIVITIF